MPSELSNGVRVFYRQSSREEILRAVKAGAVRLAACVPLREVVLFGSCAHNRHTRGSDVDLLVVYADPRQDEMFRTVKDVMGIPRLEPHVYTESEAAALRPLLERMRGGGMVVYPSTNVAPGDAV